MVPSASRRLLVHALLVAGLATAFTLFNPYWFGDAPVYARHIARGLGSAPLDSGHLLWRPLGAMTWALLGRLGLDLDPLFVLRVLSGLGTSLALIACFVLAERLTGSRRDAWVATTLAAVSNVCLSYGGSGCSYTVAMGAGALAYVLLLGRDGGEWSVRRGAGAALSLGLAWSLWGASLVLVPGLATAGVVTSTGPAPRRLARGILLAIACLAVVVAMALAANHLLTPDSIRQDDPTWIRAGTHGRPLHYAPLNVLRAVYGLSRMFVDLGTLGRTIKRSLIDGVPLDRVGDRGPAIAVAVILVAALAAGFATLLGRRGADAARARALGPIALATFVPLALFAAGWNGADIERFSLGLPVLASLIAYGACDVIAPALGARGATATRVGFACVLAVALVNVLGWVVPRRIENGGLTMSFGRLVREHLPAGSMVVVVGHEFAGNVTYATDYFYGIRVYNVSYEVAVHGVDDYAARLERSVGETLASGGRVAIVSDLAGEPTPGGIGFITLEEPKLRLGDLIRWFAGWRRVGRWQADRFTLIEVAPPAPPAVTAASP